MENKVYGYIYKFTNLINNKYYVGKHKYSKECLDEKYWGSGKLWSKVLEKYGKENIKREVLQYCKTLKELNESEQYWVEKLNARDVIQGYNLAFGGDGGDTISKKSDEEKLVIKNKWRNTHNSRPQEYIQKSKEIRAISAKHIWTNMSEEKYNEISNHRKEIWANKTQAEKDLINLHRSLGHKNRTKEQKLATSLKLSKLPKRRTKCRCIETGEIFESIAAANKKYAPADVGRCCSGKNKTAHGLHWEYY